MKHLPLIITLAIGLFISALLIIPFSVYVIMDIVKLYNVEIIKVIPKEALYGCLFIFYIVIYKKEYNNDNKDEDTENIIHRIIEIIVFAVERLLAILGCWGFAYMVHYFNF